MIVKISPEQVKKVAKLSRLDLTDSEVSEFSEQLSAILAYVEKMSKLDTEGVQPLAHCLPVKNSFRDDVVEDSLGTQKTLANAPRTQGDFFKVPKVLDDGSSA